MVNWCVVPNCKTGSRTESKRSVFRVPKDTIMWKKWEESIPGIDKLFPTSVVCEKHFDEDDISREWIKLDVNGKIIARATYKKPKLKKHAVPTKFGDVLTRNKETCAVVDEFSETKNIARVSSPTADIGMSFVPMKVSSCLQMNEYTALVDSPAPNNGLPFLSMEVSNFDSAIEGLLAHHEPFIIPTFIEISEDGTSVASLPPDSMALFLPMEVLSCEPAENVEVCSLEPAVDPLAQDESSKVPPSPEITNRTPEGNNSDGADFSAYVPESWSFGEMRTQNVNWRLFSYTISKPQNGVHCPVTHKCVTLDEDRTLNYFVYGRHVDPQDKKLQRVLNKKEMLSDILKKFKGMNVCSGLGDVNSNFILAGEAYQDYVEIWRSKDCSLLSKRKRCDSCLKARKCILQRVTRLKNRPTVSRIRDVSNPVDRRLLLAMRMKIRRVRRQKLRAEERVKRLMARIRAQEAQQMCKIGLQ